MSLKSKGINADRDLIKRFYDTGNWFACRVAGSGSSRYPSPDVIAGNRLRKLAIECKRTSEKVRYIPAAEIDQLIEFSTLFGAEAYVAVKFDRAPWHFLTIEDLKKTTGSYCVNAEIARLKGILFEELVRA